MNHLLNLSCLLALGGTTTAQITATYIAKTKMVATAYFPTTGTKVAEIPINTDLSGGKSISVSNSAIASVRVGFTNSASVLQASISESGTGRYFSSSTRAFSNTGLHSTLLTLKSAKPIKATLRASWTIRVLGTSGANASGSVDIGNNGSVEFGGSRTAVTQDFPVTIDSAGLAIATTTRGSASANSSSRSVSYTSGLTIQILPPDTCLFFKHGAPCGPSLDAKNGFGDAVTLNITGAANSGSGVIVFGLQRMTLSLPGTTCLLRVQPLVTFPISFSSSGTASLTGTIPPTRPFVLPMQVGSFGATFGTSNALTIICP